MSEIDDGPLSRLMTYGELCKKLEDEEGNPTAETVETWRKDEIAYRRGATHALAVACSHVDSAELRRACDRAYKMRHESEDLTMAGFDLRKVFARE